MRHVSLWMVFTLLLAPALVRAQSPQTGSDYVNRGNTRFEAGDFDGAIADFTEAIELTPGDSNAYFNRAYAKASLGDHQGAIVDYTESLRLNPRDPMAY